MLRNLFSRFVRDDRGVTLVEYGIALTLAVAVGGGALLALGGAVTGEMTTATGVMTATP
jgi:Flp pilus assembly pilin Flp